MQEKERKRGLVCGLLDLTNLSHPSLQLLKIPAGGDGGDGGGNNPEGLGV